MIDNAPELSQLAEQTALKYQQRFGRAPQWIVAAPGRVNLIGEHTDYNDGFVLPMAIERHTVIAAGRPVDAKSPRILWRCARMGEETTIPLDQPIQKGEPSWSNYIRGVISGFQKQANLNDGFDAVMLSTVPLGGGLSSSAALEVATATLLEVVTGKTLDPVEKALLCQKAEHDFAGVPCGIMDQFISVMGKESHLLLLDCQSRTTELVPLSDPKLSVLIINTNVKHELTGGGYAQRRAQCETAAKILGVPSLRHATMKMLEAAKDRMEPIVFKRARHVIGEIKRTVDAANAIRASKWSKVGKLMYASHASLRDDYDVSCVELDCLVDIASSIGEKGGVIGARMTGGGFGGCAVALVQASALEAIATKIAEEYTKRTKLTPTVFVSRPGPGATVIKK